VTIILDRRQGERRQTNLPHTEEHRAADRRALAIDEALQARGIVVIATPARGPNASASASLG
jgi:hypothetical protein